MGEIHHAPRQPSGAAAQRLRGGALIDVSIDYPLGAEVLLDLGEAGQYFANVAWAFGDQAGFASRSRSISAAWPWPAGLMPTDWRAPEFSPAPTAISPWNETWESQLARGNSRRAGRLKRYLIGLLLDKR